jgi:hypothetical protein
LLARSHTAYVIQPAIERKYKQRRIRCLLIQQVIILLACMEFQSIERSLPSGLPFY